MRYAIIVMALFINANTGEAAPPDLQTPAPVIYLADNLDEQDKLGWCIDTVGRGLSDRLHAIPVNHVVAMYSSSLTQRPGNCGRPPSMTNAPFYKP